MSPLSPNASRMSSRSWKANPTQRPAEHRARVVASSAPASAAPRAMGRSTEYRALLRQAARTARTTERTEVASPCTSRYCPATISIRIPRHSSRTREALSGVIPVSATTSSAQTRARSPARIAAACPSRAPRAREISSAYWAATSTCRAGRPRRSRAPSITSSWTSAQVWMSSRAAPIRRAACAWAGSVPPHARRAHHRKRERLNLPPCCVKCATRAARSWAKSGSTASAAAVRHASRSARTPRTALETSASTARGVRTAGWATDRGAGAGEPCSEGRCPRGRRSTRWSFAVVGFMPVPSSRSSRSQLVLSSIGSARVVRTDAAREGKQARAARVGIFRCKDDASCPACIDSARWWGDGRSRRPSGPSEE